MKSLQVKYLTPLVFLIFFMPFLRMCEGSKGGAFGYQKPEAASKTQVRDVNLNAYQLASLVFEAPAYHEGKLDPDFLPSLMFTLLLVFSVLMVVFSWKGRARWVKLLAAGNMLLLVMALLLYWRTGVVQNWGDLKYGVVVFFLYSGLLFYQASHEEKQGLWKKSP